MRKLGVALAAGVTTLLVAGVSAQGQLDHLLCYKMQDSFKVNPKSPTIVNMLADLQPEFTQNGCTVLKPVEFCVPASKSVTPSSANVNPNLVGQPLQNDYICYVAKCPKQVGPPAKLVTDQFGTHAQRKYQPVTVCVPAVKDPVGCALSTTGITSAAMCGGACPDPTQTCQFDRKHKKCTCGSPKTCGGKPNSAGLCGGPCQAGQMCLPALQAGTKSTTSLICECQPPPPPVCGVDPTTGTCGGTCPNPAVPSRPRVATTCPSLTPAGKQGTVAGPRATMHSAPYRFYAAEISYFSGKVRPFFRYKAIPYEEIAPTPQVYREVIIPRTGLAFIPIVVTPDDVTLQDTSDILDELERRFPEPPVYPPTPVQRVTTSLLEVYADEFGVLPAMHYRWSFPESEAKARDDFARSSGNAQTANVFADRMKGSLPLLGVHPETIPAIEAHTHDLLSILSRHFESHEFLLGSRMALADLALLGPLYAHLYLDAVPGRRLRENAPRVCAWIERMNHPVPCSGEFVAGDALPPTLLPLLQLVGSDAVPLLLDNLCAFEAWADAQPADLVEPPRGVGMHETTLRGVRFQRFTSPYTLWMVQRPLDVYRALTSSERAQVQHALDGTGLEALLHIQPRYRLGKRNFKLVFESSPPLR